MDYDSEYDSDEEPYPFVIDNGSALTKAGFAGDDKPKAVFPTLVASQLSPSTKPEVAVDCIVSRWSDHRIGTADISQIVQKFSDFEFRYVGDQAQAKRDIMCSRYPVEHGIITRWDDMVCSGLSVD